LPLKDEGAYLVVCRGDDLHASGLALVTPLAVEVQEDAASGRVRTTVKDAAAGRYVPEVHVKVIGSSNAEFTSGATDLRGVFVADGIRGASTVIAQVQPARYAFFRGQTTLGPPAEAAKTEAKPSAAAATPSAAPAKRLGAAKGEMSGKAAKPMSSSSGALLEGLQQMNIDNQSRQVEQLKQMYNRKQEGVEAQKAY
jgi:alpha-2-macroglobulin